MQMVPLLVEQVSAVVSASAEEVPVSSTSITSPVTNSVPQVMDPPMAPFSIYADQGDYDQRLKIYLPEGSLIVDNETVDLEDPGFLDTGKWYLHVNIAKKKAVISAKADEESYDRHILIAEIGTDPDLGGTYVSKQLLHGTVVISDGGHPACFDLEYDEEGKISGVLCPYVMCGREVVIASGTPTDGVNVVRVDHAHDSVTASIMSGDTETPSNSSDTYTDIPLYKIKDNKIVEDYRNMPRVPLYDGLRAE